MFRDIVNFLGKNLIPFNNPRVVCPPGPLPTASGKPIIVASIMRSGTHIAIDMLLNNFPSIANSPLYLDADQFFRSKNNREKYLQGNLEIGHCVVKTHYPQLFPEEKNAIFKDLISKSHVILLHRPVDQTYRSLSAWVETQDFEAYKESVSEFYEFWHAAAPDRLDVSFEDLTDPIGFLKLISMVEEKTGLERRSRTKYPVNPKNTWVMIVTKIATRWFGINAPTINTGIRSGMSGK
ncbi:hypothetical protein JF535_01240 [Microbulbifer salipaludis]|uniref:Sulfotransferase domain-containing protein n=1 Tax=Microbulbifer salipaludis TaxID=187980 RepID=A0ABS3E2M0_9GAMM|nr:hypothetical protein [Microbulbifer salipaludis]MBN8429463.1 hypothetical protein [Microbulbifer salipaludis]